MITTPIKINAILLNIKIYRPIGKHVLIYTGNKMAKFYGNILSLSENIAQSFRGAIFLTHTEYLQHRLFFWRISLTVKPKLG